MPDDERELGRQKHQQMCSNFAIDQGQPDASSSFSVNQPKEYADVQHREEQKQIQKIQNQIDKCKEQIMSQSAAESSDDSEGLRRSYDDYGRMLKEEKKSQKQMKLMKQIKGSKIGKKLNGLALSQIEEIIQRNQGDEENSSSQQESKEGKMKFDVSSPASFLVHKLKKQSLAARRDEPGKMVCMSEHFKSHGASRPEPDLAQSQRGKL